MKIKLHEWTWMTHKGKVAQRKQDRGYIYSMRPFI